MNQQYPDVFYDNSLIQSRDERSLCADALTAWGNCFAGISPPDSFGTTLVAIRARIGLKEAATAGNLIAFSRKKYPATP